MTATTAIAAEPTVSRAHARSSLRVGERHLRRLIAQGRLELVGHGQRGRITLGSLNLELSQKKADTECLKSGHRGNTQPFIFPGDLDKFADQPQNNSMYRPRDQSAPDRIDAIGELLPLTHAAAAVGISDEAIKKLVQTGQLPSVIVGARRRVNREILRRWAHGELNR